MKPNTIYTGNCRKVMSEWDDNCIDLTVTSPPYDNLRDYQGYTFDFEGIARQLYRVTKPGGVVVWVVGDQVVNGSETGTSFKQALYFMETGFNLHDTMIYYRWSGPLNHNRYEQEYEYMFVFSKGKPNIFNPITVECAWHGKEADRTGQHYSKHAEKNKKTRSNAARGQIKKYRIKGNVWKMNNASQSGERHNHPAPMPEDLARDHILSWSNPGDIVLDPMCGSGTTCKMAIQTGRQYVGIDISEDYVNIARKRVKYAQPALGVFSG